MNILFSKFPYNFKYYKVFKDTKITTYTGFELWKNSTVSSTVPIVMDLVQGTFDISNLSLSLEQEIWEIFNQEFKFNIHYELVILLVTHSQQ